LAQIADISVARRAITLIDQDFLVTVWIQLVLQSGFVGGSPLSSRSRSNKERGLPPDRPLAAHIVVQTGKAQAQSLGSCRVGQTEALDALTQFVAGHPTSLSCRRRIASRSSSGDFIM
jgi:hypothetical protein